MANYCFTRSILQNGKSVKTTFNLHGYSIQRTVTVATTGDKYESPELAAARPFEEMPKLPMIPFIGSAWTYWPIVGKYSLSKLHLADRHKHQRYGNVVREKFGHVNIVNSFTPDTMEVIYRNEGKFPSRGEFVTLKAYRESRRNWYKSTGVMVLEGQEWYDLRSRAQKHMMKPRAIHAFLEPMQDVAKDFVTLIGKNKDANNEAPDLLGNLCKWSLESVALVALDTRLGCLDPNVKPDSDGGKMINSVQTQFQCMNKLEPFAGNFPFWKYLPSPTWKKFTKATDVFSEISFKYINRCLDDLKKKADDDEELTLLQSLLLTEGMDASGAMVMVADMLFAGIDTTSHTVGFLLYHLAKNPEKQKILADEIKQLLPNKEDRITKEVFHSLHYLKACLKESIRLDPIVRGNARTLDHDVVINGYRVPAGTVIVCILQVVCREEKYFKNAKQFWPERWLNKDEKTEHPFAFLPFGIGIRSCIGRRLAELEMLCVATEILRKFSVEYHHEDIGMVTRMLNTPDRPLRLNFIER